MRQAVEFFTMDGAAVVRREDVHDPWEVIAATPGFALADVDAASVRVSVDEHHSLVLVGHVVTGEDSRLVAAFAGRAAALLHREELLERARQASALAKDNRARAALLAAVSHDLRTPLAGIKAAVSSLRQREVAFTADDEASLLETIEALADRLTALVTNILDMSRLQSGSVTARQDVLDVRAAIATAAAGLPGEHRLRVAADPELPSVVGDAGLLDRVLANVLENALRHDPSSAEVVIRATATGEVVQVRVVDRGLGVPDEAKELIFAPFQRYGDAPRGTGVGLGLAVARGLLEVMGGAVTAEDTPGGGLTVVLELRRAPVSPPPGAPPAPVDDALEVGS